MIRLLRLNNIRLRNKLLLLYFLAIFIPVMLTNALFYATVSSNVKQQKVKDLSYTMDSMKEEFRKAVDGAVQVSSVLYTDSVFNDDLSKSYGSLGDFIYTYYEDIRKPLRSFISIYSQIEAIELYSQNDTIIYSDFLRVLDRSVRESEWYKQLAESRNQLLIYPIPSQPDMPAAAPLSLIRKLDYFKDGGKVESILKINLRFQTLQSIFDRPSTQGEIALLDSKNNVIYSTGRTPINELLAQKGNIRIETNLSDSLYVGGWTIVGFFPEKVVLGELFESRKIVYDLVIVNLLIPTLVIVLISRSLQTRLVRLLKHMKKLKNQNFEVIDHKQDQDEVGQVTLEFNRMTVHMKNLIQDVYRADIQKKALELAHKQAQLNALQSQINPHYLFNTLEAIRMHCVIKQEDETARIIKLLAKSFRRSLHWENDLIPLQEEINFIHEFLQIQMYRFHHKFSCRIEVAEEALGRKIPKLSILSIVENACIHGLEAKSGQGTITVDCQHYGGDLYVYIADNGIGMTEETYESIVGRLASGYESGGSIGIINVYNRLKLIYEDRFDFHIESRLNSGTKVYIKLPCLMAEASESEGDENGVSLTYR
ncbi:sensor histidine kinase [Paenibacillus solisilvae]|uniref:Sensor histidine kinase n=1 Tax=Paenibacillus solisilvae TaxID=2486751 RepID=A0ABW0VZ47_9BACL